MNKETFKTLLLGALVFTSVAMTTDIWFYKTDYENYKGPSESLKSVAIADSKDLTDVVRPTLVLVRENGKLFGQTGNTSVSKVYRLIQRASFTNLSPVYGKKSIPARSGQSSYEILFPAPVTVDAFKKMFNINPDQVALQKDSLVDRIEIYHANNKSKRLTAVFRTASGAAVLCAAVGHLNSGDLHEAITNKELQPYVKQSLKNKLAYIPASSTTVKAIVAYYESIRFNEFIPILFNDPDNVFLSKGKTAYSDGSSQLEKTGNIMQYVNPGSDDSTAQDSEDVILHSYDFINNFKGWTDDFVFDDLSLSDAAQRSDVEFRMKIGNYLVFNTEYYPNPYLATMDLEWRNGTLRNMNRTLLNLNPIYEKESYTLDSGEDILQKLRAVSIPAAKIQDLQIGYELKNPALESSSSVELIPEWFYKQDGRWHAVSDAIYSKTQIGEERTPS